MSLSAEQIRNEEHSILEQVQIKLDKESKLKTQSEIEIAKKNLQLDIECVEWMIKIQHRSIIDFMKINNCGLNPSLQQITVGCNGVNNVYFRSLYRKEVPQIILEHLKIAIHRDNINAIRDHFERLGFSVKKCYENGGYLTISWSK